MRHQARFERGGDQQFEVAAADLGVRELGGDDLALFGQADLAVDGARRLRQDRFVARPAAAPDGAAAAVEQAQLDAGVGEHLDQVDLGLVQLPVGGQEAAVLVGVGVAEHDFLQLALARDQLRHQRQRHPFVHDAGRALQVGDGLEQRDHHRIEFAGGGAQQAGFLLQQQHFEQVGHGLGVRDDVVADRPHAVALADVLGRAQDRQLAVGLVGIAGVRRIQQARLAQFGQQQRDLALFRQVAVARLRRAALANSSASTRSCTSEVWRMSSEARWKPKMAAARFRRDRRGRASIAPWLQRQRIGQHLQVGAEGFGVAVGRGRADFLAQDVGRAQRARGGGQPRVDADQRAPVRLVAAVRRGVGRGVGQRLQRRASRSTISVEIDSSAPSACTSSR